MKKNDLSEFEMETEGFKIKLKKGVDFPATGVISAAPQPLSTPTTLLGAELAATPRHPTMKAEPAFKEILSPMVGTFYLAASPESAPYVEVGKEITGDTVVCLIEAMKVMNEIKAEMSGVIAEILVENGKPVGFGQPLFRVK